MTENAKRHKTDYPGVFYRIAKRKGEAGTEKVYYVRYKEDGKIIEAKAGRQYANQMTPAKASKVRGDYIEGRQLTPQEKRAKERQKAWTVEELSTAYFDTLKESKGVKTDKGRYNLYLKDRFGSKKPKDITPIEIERLTRRDMQGKSPQTIKHVLTLLKRISNYGVKSRLCDGISFHIASPKFDNRVTEDLTPAELKKLLKVMDKHPDQLVCNVLRMAMYTGMRRGEILKLQWDHVDFHRKAINIVDPKGGQDAKIPMNPQAEKLLFSLKRHPLSVYVFPGKGGRQRVEIGKACRDIKEKAGLPKEFRMVHGLRHYFASTLASSGQVDLYTLQRLLTHKTSVVTQRYAHLRDEALKNASNLAGNLVMGQNAKRGAKK